MSLFFAHFSNIYSFVCLFRVKSGVWDSKGVFLYSTENHSKYTLTNGDNGIIKTMDEVLYLTGISGETVYALNRKWEVVSMVCFQKFNFLKPMSKIF